ncbi:MAG: GAF domain-containing protein [Candidatus Eisenbacteria bacterium]
MSKFHLRDISERLTSSLDLEGVIDQLLAYLRAVQPDWHPTLAFYEGSRDSFVRVYGRERGRLERRDMIIPVDQLPARLVRKFFQPSAFFNADGRRSFLAKLFQSNPVYEPDRFEAVQLQPLAAPLAWQSSICLPLADQDDLLAMLVITSPRKNAFPSQSVGEIIPVKSLAALAIARRLHAAGRPTPESRHAEENTRQATVVMQDRLREMEERYQALAEDDRGKDTQLNQLAHDLEALHQHRDAYRDELERVKQNLGALEEQTGAAASHLNEAYAQLAGAQSASTDMRRTLDFLRDVFQVLAREHDEKGFTRTLVAWFCEQFEVERCSLMRADEQGTGLRILAQRGLDPKIAGAVRVRVGQGVSGWVAHHKRPLFVRMRQDASLVNPSGVDAYNSDSFISVPLVHRERLLGVLNLSNKRDGAPFDDMDFERAMLTGSVLALALGGQETAKAAACA